MISLLPILRRQGKGPAAWSAAVDNILPCCQQRWPWTSIESKASKITPQALLPSGQGPVVPCEELGAGSLIPSPLSLNTSSSSLDLESADSLSAIHTSVVESGWPPNNRHNSFNEKPFPFQKNLIYIIVFCLFWFKLVTNSYKQNICHIRYCISVKTCCTIGLVSVHNRIGVWSSPTILNLWTLLKFLERLVGSTTKYPWQKG